jgi:predicted NBD/HSP70 family sugar kinase
MFADDGTVVRVDGAHRSNGSALAIATPGIVEGSRVVAASNLGWLDVDPAEALGLDGPADLVLNDAEAAALGELALRDLTDDIVFVSLGTGVGGAVVLDGTIVANNLFGHCRGFSDMPCVCGRRGCLETIAAGWALPAPLTDRDRDHVARAVAAAIDIEPIATGPLVVVGGGLAARYPDLVMRIADRSPLRVVEPSAAPQGFKSASAWGSRAMVDRAASAPAR